MRGSFPLSLFIARASGSPFHIPASSPSRTDYPSCTIARKGSSARRSRSGCSSASDSRCQAIEGRAAAPNSRRHRIRRRVYDQQVPFDSEFRMDDQALYCVEMTEKAFRSQGLALSEAVRSEIGKTWRTIADRPGDPERLGAICGVPDHARAACLPPGKRAARRWAHHRSRRYSGRNCYGPGGCSFTCSQPASTGGHGDGRVRRVRVTPLLGAARSMDLQTRSATEFSRTARSRRS